MSLSLVPSFPFSSFPLSLFLSGSTVCQRNFVKWSRLLGHAVWFTRTQNYLHRHGSLAHVFFGSLKMYICITFNQNKYIYKYKKNYAVKIWYRSWLRVRWFLIRVASWFSLLLIFCTFDLFKAFNCSEWVFAMKTYHLERPFNRCANRNEQTSCLKRSGSFF